MNPLVVKLETVAALSPEDRSAIGSLCDKTHKVARGRDIVREGTQPDQIYVIMRGWAARYKLMPDGARQITAFLIPGDLCDFEITALKQMDHSIIALTDVEVAAISRDNLVELTRSNAGIAQAFWWATLVDVAILRAWVVNLGKRDAFGRIAHLACELHGRMKRIGLATDAELVLPLTQEELGDALGLTPVHVNRMLKRLREEGLMTMRSRVLTILNGERLGRVASFDAKYLHA